MAERVFTISQIAEILKAYFIRHFGTYFANSDLVSYNKLDKLVETITATGSQFALYFEFGGMSRRNSEHFGGRDWNISFIGSFWIRYIGDEETVDSYYENVVGLLRTFLVSDPTLGGTVKYATINKVDMAEQVTLQEMPIYWIPFTIEVVDRVN